MHLDSSEVRIEGLETLDYLDNLSQRERFTEQGDAITFESEVPFLCFDIHATCGVYLSISAIWISSSKVNMLPFSFGYMAAVAPMNLHTSTRDCKELSEFTLLQFSLLTTPSLLCASSPNLLSCRGWNTFEI